MFKLAADFLSLDFLCRPNQKNKPESKVLRFVLCNGRGYKE
jgi:hypothetical protein